MKRAVLVTVLIACAFRAANAQPADSAVEFEVASIKPSMTLILQSAPGCSGGPGSSDPGRFTCNHALLSSIVASAYELKQYQYSSPAWMNSIFFDIAAKVPVGTTKEQFRLMKQNLLTERFKLAVHFEKREMQVYELVIGKDGPKFKELRAEPEGAPDAPPISPADFMKLRRDGDGVPTIPLRPGTSSVVGTTGPNGALMRIQASAQTIEQFASRLRDLMNKPVTDATGLKGRYDITLTCAPPEGSGFRTVPGPVPSDNGASPTAPVADGGPTIFAAIQQQLGLKLEQKRGTVDFLVIDHMEKSPVDN